MRHLIIGSGIAGLQAARTLRAVQPEAEVTMLGREQGNPYSRPMISQLLEGSVQTNQLDLGLPPKVELIAGESAVSIDTHQKVVKTSRSRHFPYDRLLVASGADPRPIAAGKADLQNIHFMRTRAQVEEMLAEMPRCRKALVLGGGLVGFKAAYAFLRQGLDVSMLIRSEHPLSQQVDPTAGGRILEKLQENGLRVSVGLEVAEFLGHNGRVVGAELSDGSRIDCDLVVVGKGVLPSTGFLDHSGIVTDLGILVDDFLRTSAPDVFAAGDVAEHFDLARGRRWVNAIWPEAAEQGRIAGLNMAGRQVRYPGSVSRNTIRIFDLDILTCGLVDPGSEEGYEVLQDQDSRTKTYRRLVFSDDRLVGAVCLNRIEHGGLLLYLIKSGRPVPAPKEELLQPGFHPGRLGLVRWQAMAASSSPLPPWGGFHS